jgi:hypothetical protein
MGCSIVFHASATKHKLRERGVTVPGIHDTGSASMQGDAGQRLYTNTHNDIDESTIEVRCRSGSCRVMLEEAIWYTWVNRLNRDLAAGGCIIETVEVDSAWYDGDHRLIVTATADGTTATIDFTSTDR